MMHIITKYFSDDCIYKNLIMLRIHAIKNKLSNYCKNFKN